MVEAGVDHAIGFGGTAFQTFQILERTAMDFGANGPQLFSTLLRAGQAKHLMAGRDQFLDDGRATQPVAPVTNTRMSIPPFWMETHIGRCYILVK